MLDALQVVHGAVAAVRLVAPDKTYVDALKEMGVTIEDFDENLAYFGNLDATPQSGLDWIFEVRGQQSRPQTRFTDGSVPVYYTALNRATAEREQQRWLSGSEKVYFRELSVDFEGSHVDLAELDPIPTCLTDEQLHGAYDDCFEVTKLAIALPCDGFKTPSARLPEGVCFPILTRESIRGLQTRGYVSFDFDSAAGRWSCRDL